MTMANNKRPQRAKNMGNRAMYDAMVELRRSSAAQPHRNKTRYRREKSGNQSWKGDM